MVPVARQAAQDLDLALALSAGRGAGWGMGGGGGRQKGRSGGRPAPTHLPPLPLLIPSRCLLVPSPPHPCPFACLAPPLPCPILLCPPAPHPASRTHHNGAVRQLKLNIPAAAAAHAHTHAHAHGGREAGDASSIKAHAASARQHLWSWAVQVGRQELAPQASTLRPSHSAPLCVHWRARACAEPGPEDRT